MVKVKNAAIDRTAGRMYLSDSTYLNLSEMDSLTYSNDNLSSHLGMIGASLGLITMIALNNNSGKESGGVANSSGNEEILIPVAAIPLGLLGYWIGSKIYYNWQGFNLDPYHRKGLSINLKPVRDGIGIGIIIPIRR